MPGSLHRAGIGTCSTGVDDYCRLVYSEILDDEKKHTAPGFWKPANRFFTRIGVAIETAMTDNHDR